MARPVHSDVLRKWVDDFIRDSEPGKRLPAVTTLGKRFNLSESTIRKILRRLTARGRLRSIPGKGTFTPFETPREQRPPVAFHVDAVQSIVREVRDLISEGKLKTGDMLPSNKYMCGMFRVAPRTVTAAYRTLLEDKLVSKVGKYYRVGRLNQMIASANRRSVFLLAPDAGVIERFLDVDEYELMYNSLERELCRRDYRIHFDTYAGFRRGGYRAIARKAPLGGFFVLGNNNLALSKAQVQTIGPILAEAIQRTRTRFCPAVIVSKGYAEPQKDTYYFSVSHQKTALMRQLSAFVLQKKATTVLFVIPLDRVEFRLLVNYLRFMPEILHLDSTVDLSFVFLKGGGIKSKRAFIDKITTQWSSGHLEARLSKYTSLPFHMLQERFFVPDSLDPFLRNAAPGTTVLCTVEQKRFALAGISPSLLASPRLIRHPGMC